MIILEPLGGLANRMRVIASGIWLKNKLNTELEVIWHENYELTCPYSSLFEPDSMFRIVSKQKKYDYVKSSNQLKMIDKLRAKIGNKLLNIDYCIQEQDFSTLIWTGKLDIYESVKKHKYIYIQTCQEFGDNLFAFQYFKPIPKILSKIQQVTRNFTEHTVGIHIRRTDNTHSTKYSPLDLFLKAMETEIKIKNDTIFFLCSDDRSVKDEIINTFGNKVITMPNEVNRKTVDGMQNAVIDLYCLSKTNKILGSYWSSYSEVASHLTNIELEILKTE